VARRILRERRRDEERRPLGIADGRGVSVRIGQGDGGVGPPEDVVALRLPARDAGICYGDVDRGQYERVLEQRHVPLRAKVERDVVPEVICRARIPELAVQRLIGCTNRARDAAKGFRFFEVRGLASAA
jgi:hypothetical protein